MGVMNKLAPKAFYQGFVPTSIGDVCEQITGVCITRYKMKEKDIVTWVQVTAAFCKCYGHTRYLGDILGALTRQEEGFWERKLWRKQKRYREPDPQPKSTPTGNIATRTRSAKRPQRSPAPHSFNRRGPRASPSPPTPRSRPDVATLTQRRVLECFQEEDREVFEALGINNTPARARRLERVPSRSPAPPDHLQDQLPPELQLRTQPRPLTDSSASPSSESEAEMVPIPVEPSQDLLGGVTTTDMADFEKFSKLTIPLLAPEPRARPISGMDIEAQGTAWTSDSQPGHAATQLPSERQGTPEIEVLYGKREPPIDESEELIAGLSETSRVIGEVPLMLDERLRASLQVSRSQIPTSACLQTGTYAFVRQRHRLSKYVFKSSFHGPQRVYESDHTDSRTLQTSGGAEVPKTATFTTNFPVLHQECTLSYSEIAVDYLPPDVAIAIGLVDTFYKSENLPGCGENCFGLHSDDSSVVVNGVVDHVERGLVRFPASIGILCHLKESYAMYFIEGRPGEKFSLNKLRKGDDFFLAVGVSGSGVRWRLTFVGDLRDRLQQKSSNGLQGGFQALALSQDNQDHLARLWRFQASRKAQGQTNLDLVQAKEVFVTQWSEGSTQPVSATSFPAPFPILAPFDRSHELSLYIEIRLLELPEDCSFSFGLVWTHYAADQLPGFDSHSLALLNDGSYMCNGDRYDYTSPLKAGVTVGMLVNASRWVVSFTIDGLESREIPLRGSSVLRRALHYYPAVGTDAEGVRFKMVWESSFREKAKGRLHWVCGGSRRPPNFPAVQTLV